ncbi:2-amino-4-hydroxy-6-hydroxymethyldihydropteridine diphosphokinase [Thorsellia kenyensis]|uniref:2-amino-4-hydroxy-6-hydroxymethyldihydropteridine pyrophosphokinase n=1 Tax=Thorsellia kenyensis TaxID=1549888 RepID=A0ABV6CCL1_9GAMM
MSNMFSNNANHVHRAYLALGSNLGDPMLYINNAITSIKKLEFSSFIKVSSFYRTKPLGGLSQNDYLNAVVAIDTQLTPIELLNRTQAIELQQGRVRTKERFASRTLDIDILLYGNSIMNDERLTLPHHGLLEREFMLFPLFDIAPGLILPNGEPLADIIRKTDKNGMVLWSD